MRFEQSKDQAQRKRHSSLAQLRHEPRRVSDGTMRGVFRPRRADVPTRGIRAETVVECGPALRRSGKAAKPTRFLQLHKGGTAGFCDQSTAATRAR